MDDSAVRLDLHGPVATIRLDRPHALNALDISGFQAFQDAIYRLRECKDVRAVVIRGEGKAFMAGADISVFKADMENASRSVVGMIDALHPAIIALGQLSQPVVAAVNGAVAGAGMSLMLACDFAIATESTRFSLAYPKIGGSLDGGSSWLLPRIVGRRKATEIAMLAEPLSATEALQLGLINEVIAPDNFEQAIQKWSNRLSTGPSVSYAHIKRLLAASYDNSLQEQLDLERSAFSNCAETSDFKEGITAFTQKRPATFTGN